MGVQPDLNPPEPPVPDLAPPFVEDMSPPTDLDLPFAEVPQTPVTIAVKLGSLVTEAGVSNRVTCQLYDQNGERLLDPDLLEDVQVNVRPREGWAQDEADPSLVTGYQANPYEVRCALPSWSLRSAPASWEVVAGPPQRLITFADPPQLSAGEESELECLAYDAYGKQTTLTPLEEDPSRARLRATLAGVVSAECSSPSATELSPASIYVTPGLPARLITGVRNGRTTFFLGEVIELETSVLDAFDNEIEDASLLTTLTPNDLSTFGPLRYQATTPGDYDLDVRVSPPTYEDRDLSERLSWRVDDGAPQLRCESPAMGATLPLSPLTVRAHVEDSAGLDEVTFDGRPVSVSVDGSLNVQVTPTWGLNVHELSARDEFGQVNSALCAYFASPSYLTESAGIDDVALVSLTQQAIDDGAPRSPINSLGDLIGGVLNSSALISTINSAMRAQNPIVPVECRVPGLFGSCIASAGASFDSLSVSGPNTVSLNLRTGGVRLNASVNNIRVNLTASGRAGFNWSQSGYITVSSVSLSGNLNMGLSGSSPTVTLSGTPSVSVGSLTLNLNINVPLLGSALNGFLNLILNLFEDAIRDIIADQIKSFVTSQVDSLLTSALSNLDLSAIGLNLTLPSLFGGDPVRLNLSFSMNRLEASSRRLRLGLRGRVTGSRAHSRTSSGVAIPSGSITTEVYPGSGQDLGGSAHIALLNAALHRLWRAGMFDVVSLGDSLPGLPPGLELSLETLTPPALELYGPGTRARLHFGPARAQVRYPGLIDEPITLYLAAWASASVSLNSSDTLTFGNLTVNDLKLGAEGVPLSNQARAALQLTFTDILQSLFDTALNDALPSFPIPEFAIPNTFTSLGVPRNLRLGARSLTLEQNGRHLIVKGDFRQ
jgi:hypothetical protein